MRHDKNFDLSEVIFNNALPFRELLHKNLFWYIFENDSPLPSLEVVGKSLHIDRIPWKRDTEWYCPIPILSCRQFLCIFHIPEFLISAILSIRKGLPFSALRSRERLWCRSFFRQLHRFPLFLQALQIQPINQIRRFSRVELLHESKFTRHSISKTWI